MATVDLDHRVHLPYVGTDPGGTSSKSDLPRLPQIILRDQVGRVLDTDTSYQRAINAGRLKISRGSTNLEPGEWRLPHAPVPFKPDYSRVGPPAKGRTGIRETKKTKEVDLSHSVQTNKSEAEDRMEENIAKYRLHLLRDPHTMNLLGHAGTFLAQVEREHSQTTYLPFTFCVPVGTKPTTDQGKTSEMGEYTFPGFCTGCQRTNALVFCYGCERDSNPHYHQDKTGRTGGGFTYVRRDRPLFELTNKNPLNWRTMLTNTPYIFYDGMLVPSLEKYGVAARVDGLDKRPQHLRYPDDFPGGLDRLRLQSAENSNLLPPDQMYMLFPHPTDGTIGPTPIYDLEEGEEEAMDGEEEEGSWESDSGRGETVLDLQEFSEKERGGLETTVDEAGEEEEKATEEENVEEESQQPEKKQLYQPPKAFQLKKRDSKPTIAATPFSKNRELSIPKYTGVDIKKSDKKPTKFIEVNLGDASWKAPEPFTLKERNDSPDKELQGPPTKTNDQSQQRKASVGVKLAPLVVDKRSSGSYQKKSRSSEGEISIDRGKPKKRPERPGSADSGVSSITVGPRTTIRNGTTGLPGESRMTAQTLVNEEKTPLRRKKSSVVASTKSEDTETTTDQEVDDEGHTGERKPRQKSREVSKKEKSREQRRVPGRKLSLEEEDEGTTRTPPVPCEDSTPESENEDEDELMIFKDHSLPLIDLSSRLPEPLPLPKIDPPLPPKMMEFVEPLKPTRELSTTEVETPPPMVEPPRQKPPQPVFRDKRKSRRMSRPMMTYKRQIGAPVPITEVKDIVDPLDWLAKYCIVHPERLPVYLRVFSKATSEQVYRYADVPHPDDVAPTTDGQNSQEQSHETSRKEAEQSQGQSVAGVATVAEQERSRPQKTRLTDEEVKRIHDVDCVGVVLKPEYAMAGKNEGDANIDKINYTLDVLIDKYETLQEQLDRCTALKVKLLVDMTRKHFPELTKPSYDPQPKTTKKKTGKKKLKKEAPAEDKSKTPMQVTEPEQQPAMHEITAQQLPEELKPFGDLDIIARLQEKHLNAFSKDTDLCRLNLEITRLKEKLKDVDDRIDDLEDEKKLLQLYARDEYLRSQTANAKPEKFLRKQSPLYQKLHPTQDVEMNLSELEEALQQINGHLITQKELQYILFILNIPGRRRIDVQLFSVIAALSEKVAQVDPFIRKLINKFDFEALHVKMERSKELFTLLTVDDADVPLGKTAAQMLGVELAAGGVSEEHTKYVLSKFNRENKGIVDFLDFLTYIPLFIEIHNRILDSPLAFDRSW